MVGQGDGFMNKCPHCGQLMKVYRRSIRKNMLPGLYALSDRTPKKTSELGLTIGARSDFTILRYWGLICKQEDSKWSLTDKGRNFLNGELSIAKYLYIFNSQIEGKSNELLNIYQIEDIFDKEEFMNHSVPLDEFNAEELE